MTEPDAVPNNGLDALRELEKADRDAALADDLATVERITEALARDDESDV